MHRRHDLLRPSKPLFSSWSVSTDTGHRLPPLVVAIRANFPFSLCPPSAADALCLACRRLINAQPRVTLMKTEGAFCLSALPSHAALSTLSFQQWHAPPSSPGVMSTAGAIRWGHANFVIGNQSASQLSHICIDRDAVWTEEGSIIMQERVQIEPFVFLHEGHDKEVPGWIPRA